LGGDPEAKYPIPPDAGFGADFGPAPDIARIAEALIAAEEVRFGFLRDVDVRYLWKRKGGKSKGKATLGKCVKASGLVKYLGSDADFVIWVAADATRERALTTRQMEALVFHELLHISQGDDGEPILVGHDFEGFAAELDTYGPWSADLKLAARSVRQAGLWDLDEED
jgi:hypothetical protein